MILISILLIMFVSGECRVEAGPSNGGDRKFDVGMATYLFSLSSKSTLLCASTILPWDSASYIFKTPLPRGFYFRICQ